MVAGRTRAFPGTATKGSPRAAARKTAGAVLIPGPRLPETPGPETTQPREP